MGAIGVAKWTPMGPMGGRRDPKMDPVGPHGYHLGQAMGPNGSNTPQNTQLGAILVVKEAQMDPKSTKKTPRWIHVGGPDGPKEAPRWIPFLVAEFGKISN